jgi:hypothetical protein
MHSEVELHAEVERGPRAAAAPRSEQRRGPGPQGRAPQLRGSGPTPALARSFQPKAKP